MLGIEDFGKSYYEVELMKEQNLYSIGEVSKICNVSKKTLRFYDKIGLISPDVVSEENNYRYYSEDTLLFIPVIKYFKQMGFKLEEMKEYLKANSDRIHEHCFYQKIEELRQQETQLQRTSTSVRDWYSMLLEADQVIKKNVTDVSIKFVNSITTCYLEQVFSQNYKPVIINIEWTNYLEKNKQLITGAVNLWFKDYKQKNAGKDTTCRIFQRCITDCSDLPMITVGGDMYVTCYHIGSHESLPETYNKILEWADKHGYKCSGESIERYVTDYWTFRDSEEFVTEVLIKVLRK